MDGVLLIDKPAGLTSAEIVRRVKARVKPARVGHLGTLDPFATGLLPILVGQGTKLAPFLEKGEKEYRGTISLGAETDTLDRCGEIVRVAEVPALDAAALAQVAARFAGRIEQIPPVFSAIKRDGVPLYKLARRGEVVEPAPPRQIEISVLHLEPESAASLRFTVVCSTGTYIRSLARDIGVALGTAAHLAELRRYRSSGFSIGNALELNPMLGLLEKGGASALVGMREALAALSEVSVDEPIRNRLYNGDWAALDGVKPPQSGPFKVICDRDLVAIAELGADRRANLLRVFPA